MDLLNKWGKQEAVAEIDSREGDQQK